MPVIITSVGSAVKKYEKIKIEKNKFFVFFNFDICAMTISMIDRENIA